MREKERRKGRWGALARWQSKLFTLKRLHFNIGPSSGTKEGRDACLPSAFAFAIYELSQFCCFCSCSVPLCVCRVPRSLGLTLSLSLLSTAISLFLFSPFSLTPTFQTQRQPQTESPMQQSSSSSLPSSSVINSLHRKKSRL